MLQKKYDHYLVFAKIPAILWPNDAGRHPKAKKMRSSDISRFVQVSFSEAHNEGLNFDSNQK